MLEPGRISAITWSIGGERTGEISLAAQANGVRLLYSLTGRDGAKTASSWITDQELGNSP
jgi:hypothetical protein